jgi:hypothetical protein
LICAPAAFTGIRFRWLSHSVGEMILRQVSHSSQLALCGSWGLLIFILYREWPRSVVKYRQAPKNFPLHDEQS